MDAAPGTAVNGHPNGVGVEGRRFAVANPGGAEWVVASQKIKGGQGATLNETAHPDNRDGPPK